MGISELIVTGIKTIYVDIDGVIAQRVSYYYTISRWLGERVAMFFVESHLKINPQTKESLEILTCKGYRIVILTCRPESHYWSTNDWLEKNGIQFDKIFFVKDKSVFLMDRNDYILIDDKEVLGANQILFTTWAKVLELIP